MSSAIHSLRRSTKLTPPSTASTVKVVLAGSMAKKWLSWIACALGHKACRDGKSVLYQRTPRLFEALALARGDGRYARLLKSIARVQLLILDDWGLARLADAEQRDLLEILEDRHQRASTLVTSQVPVEQWCEIIANPTLADAILDRLVHNAHRLVMTGESMRKLSAKSRRLDLQQKP